MQQSQLPPDAPEEDLGATRPGRPNVEVKQRALYSVEIGGQRFTQDRALGTGALGIAYLYRNADPSGSPKQIVLKEIRIGLGAAALAEEVEILRRMGIVTDSDLRISKADKMRLLEHGLIAMEYIAGRELAKVLPPGMVIPERQALHLAYKIARDLVRVQGTGVTHRDLKAGNIMLTSDGEVRVIDFGISSIGGLLPERKRGLGTPLYMSPQQLDERKNADAEPARPVTDVYSLGLLLYEQCMGESLVYSPGDSLEAVVEKNAKGFEQQLKSMPAFLRDLLAHALAKNEEDRWPMPVFMQRLGAACQAQGVDPDAPLFTLAASEESPTADHMREAMSQDHVHTTLASLARAAGKRVGQMLQMVSPFVQSEKKTPRTIDRLSPRERQERRLTQEVVSSMRTEAKGKMPKPPDASQAA